MTGVAMVKWAVTPLESATPDTPEWNYDWYEAGVVDQFWGELEENYSFDVIFTEECWHRIWVKAIDAVGHTYYTYTDINVDLYGPTVKSVNLTPVPTNEDLTTTLWVEIEDLMTGGGTKSNIVAYEWWIDGNDPGQGQTGHVIPVSPAAMTVATSTTIPASVIEALSEGDGHVIYVRALDAMGNWSTHDGARPTWDLGYLNYEEFIVDRAEMGIFLTTLPDDPTADPLAAVSGFAQDSTALIAALEYRFTGPYTIDWMGVTLTDGDYDELYEGFGFTETLTSDGVWTIEVSGADAAGNQNLVSYQFTLDTTDPFLTVSAPATTDVALVHVTGTATDNMTGVAMVKWAVTPLESATPDTPEWNYDWYEAGVVDQS